MNELHDVLGTDTDQLLDNLDPAQPRPPARGKRFKMWNGAKYLHLNKLTFLLYNLVVSLVKSRFIIIKFYHLKWVILL